MSVPGRQGRYFKDSEKQRTDAHGRTIAFYEPISDEQTEKLKAFALERLRLGFFIGDLPDELGVAPSVVRWWRIEDPVFSAQFDQAVSEGTRRREVVWMDDFLDEYRKTFNVGRACRKALIRRVDYSRAIRDNAEFREAVDEVKQDCLDDQEGSLHRRGLGDGKEANMASIMLLNAHRSDIYKGKGDNTQPGNVTFVLNMGKKDDEPKQLPPQTGKEIVLDG